MRELSLFSGIGGGLLGSKLLGWRPVGYVEIDDYCQRVIAQRIEDGFLPVAPILGDIRTFIDQGFAGAYKGMVDIVTAGFPCQPWSVSGSHKGEMDPRNMWPWTIRVIREVRPAWCLLENVPGLLTRRHGYYFGQILKDLAEAGFDAQWGCVSAGDVGAAHLRERVWILSSNTFDKISQRRPAEASKAERAPRSQTKQLSGLVQPGAWPSISECKSYGKDDGLPYRVERTRTLGGSQVPAVVRAVWLLMTGE